jgi:hypothetical protein
MKKIISFLLISLILVQTTDVNMSDILQIKDLYQHAKFHQEMYGDSFIDFLSEHYGEKEIAHQGEDEEHGKLPFKHQHNCADAAPVFTVFNTSFTINEQPTTIENKTHFFYKEHTSFFEKPSVFQPPQA